MSKSLIKAEGGAFTELLNKAGIEEMEKALRFKGLNARKRSRIQAALDNKRQPQPAPAEPAADVGPRAKKSAKADKVAKDKKPSGLDAAVAVLAEAKVPMTTGEMIKRMLETGLWKTNGKTPAATIYSAILREINVKGAESRFHKTERGHFELTEVAKAVK
jgi:hypothetical protein